MLNEKTIISSFDNNLTLMQWLKNVEKALKEGSAKNFEVIKKGEATISFKLTFMDDTFIESNDIVLQQGETGVGIASVSLNATNHLIVTYTNGSVEDAGQLFSTNLNISNDLQVGNDVTIGNDLDVEGNITGQQVSGKEILEIMKGYLFDASSGLSAGIEPVYVGISKTGNKLTLVESLIIDATQLSTVQPRFGRILIPKEIGDKIYELPNDQYGTFSGSLVPMYQEGSYSAPKYNVGVIGAISHNWTSTKSALNFGINGFNSSSFDMTKRYFVRFEITILLSDNLVGN